MTRNRDLIAKFSPLSEEEQRAMLYAMLDMLDDYAEKAEKELSKKKPSESKLIHIKEIDMLLTTLCLMMMEPPEWTKEIGIDSREFGIKQAKRMLDEFESRKGQA